MSVFNTVVHLIFSGVLIASTFSVLVLHLLVDKVLQLCIHPPCGLNCLYLLLFSFPASGVSAFCSLDLNSVQCTGLMFMLEVRALQKNLIIAVVIINRFSMSWYIALFTSLLNLFVNRFSVSW